MSVSPFKSSPVSHIRTSGFDTWLITSVKFCQNKICTENSGTDLVKVKNFRSKNLCIFVGCFPVWHSNRLNSSRFGYCLRLVSYEKVNSCFIPILPGWTCISSRRSQWIPSDARRRNSSFKSLSRGCWKEPATQTKQQQPTTEVSMAFKTLKLGVGAVGWGGAWVQI